MDVAAEADPDLAQESLSEPAEVQAGTGESNKFQQAIAAWRNINLTKLIPNLDTVASDLVAHQRDALVERKELAQKTKDFRKLDDSGKLVEIKSLLKAYQTYIDLVSNSSKSVSSSFLQLYSSLSEAPDPYPLLEATVDSLVVSEVTLPKVEEENTRLQATVAKLTTQLDESESRLQNERQARQKLESSQQSASHDIESTWSAVLKEKENNWKAKERSLEERMESQDRLIKDLKASIEVSQRMDRSDEGESELARGAASVAELEIVHSDLDRAHSRLAEVEARNEQLRLELAQSTTHGQQSAAASAIEDDPAFMRLRTENSSLLRKADAAKFKHDSDKREWDTNMRVLNKQLNSLRADCDALRKKADRWADYEDMKRELEVLKSIEFSTGDDDYYAANDKTDEVKGSEQNLEQLLLARNKKLNNELTVLRVSHQDLAGRLESLQDELSDTNMELEKSRGLAATLENDLSKMQHSGTAAMSMTGTYASRYPSSSYHGRKTRGSPTSSIISGIDGGSVQVPSLEALRAGEPVGGGSGILPMITAQRDRFKKRNAELESELAKAHQSLSAVRSEVASLQKDNLNLYEKTRYVSTFNRGHPVASASSTGYNSTPNSATIEMGAMNGAPIDRYRSAYESKLSPFAAFRGRESARALKRMTLPERVVFQITRLVLATRTSRNLFALYCLALHILMFFMLYWSSSVDIEKHSSHFADATAQLVGSAGAAIANGEPVESDDWQQAGFQEA